MRKNDPMKIYYKKLKEEEAAKRRENMMSESAEDIAYYDTGREEISRILAELILGRRDEKDEDEKNDDREDKS